MSPPVDTVELKLGMVNRERKFVKHKRNKNKTVQSTAEQETVPIPPPKKWQKSKKLTSPKSTVSDVATTTHSEKQAGSRKSRRSRSRKSSASSMEAPQDEVAKKQDALEVATSEMAAHVESIDINTLQPIIPPEYKGSALSTMRRFNGQVIGQPNAGKLCTRVDIDGFVGQGASPVHLTNYN